MGRILRQIQFVREQQVQTEPKKIALSFKIVVFLGINPLFSDVHRDPVSSFRNTPWTLFNWIIAHCYWADPCATVRPVTFSIVDNWFRNPAP